MVWAAKRPTSRALRHGSKFRQEKHSLSSFFWLRPFSEDSSLTWDVWVKDLIDVSWWNSTTGFNTVSEEHTKTPRRRDVIQGFNVHTPPNIISNTRIFQPTIRRDKIIGFQVTFLPFGIFRTGHHDIKNGFVVWTSNAPCRNKRGTQEAQSWPR